MSQLLIVEPMPIVLIGASRGSGATNLGTPDPREVWADQAIGTATLLVDLGAVRTIDTIFLGYLYGADAAASWSIKAGVEAADTAVLGVTTLRAADVAGDYNPVGHALWHGPTIAARYVSIAVTQPAGAPLMAGVLVLGRAFAAQLGPEWGSGRQPIDTGSVTALPSGGFAIVEGVRKLLHSWIFGDLSVDEAERLETIALHLGETRPGVVIEDPARAAGLRRRIRYGLFKRWRVYERRNRRQTRWEVSIEDWV